MRTYIMLIYCTSYFSGFSQTQKPTLYKINYQWVAFKTLDSNFRFTKFTYPNINKYGEEELKDGIFSFWNEFADTAKYNVESNLIEYTNFGTYKSVFNYNSYVDTVNYFFPFSLQFPDSLCPLTDKTKIRNFNYDPLGNSLESKYDVNMHIPVKEDILIEDIKFSLVLNSLNEKWSNDFIYALSHGSLDKRANYTLIKLQYPIKEYTNIYLYRFVSNINYEIEILSKDSVMIHSNKFKSFTKSFQRVKEAKSFPWYVSDEYLLLSFNNKRFIIPSIIDSNFRRYYQHRKKDNLPDNFYGVYSALYFLELKYFKK